MTSSGDGITGRVLDDRYWVDQAQQLIARLAWGETLDPAESRQLRQLVEYIAPLRGDDGPKAAIDWGWKDLGEFAEFPAPTHLVDGLLVAGGITLMFAPVKSGKSTFTMSLIRALSPGGPLFCGQALTPTPTLLFSEEPLSVIGDRVRQFEIPPGTHICNTAAALVMQPDDFAQEVHRAYLAHDERFGLVVVDTLGAFCGVKDLNDYALVGRMMEPLRQLARLMPETAFFLLHHQNKSTEGSKGWAGALGSTALTGSVDQLVKLSKRGDKRQLTVGGRYSTAPFPYDKPVTVTITPKGVEVVDGVELAEYLTAEPVTIRDLLAQMGDDAPGRSAVNDALRQMVKDGEAEMVSEAKGRTAATYSLITSE